MTLIEALSRLEKIGKVSFDVSEAATVIGVDRAHASKILKRLSLHGKAYALYRGKWLLTQAINPLAIVETLTFPFPSYVSLQSALFYHEMIDQIPEIHYVVSLSRTQRVNTSIGVYSVHHLPPELFYGFERVGLDRIPIATKEKALFDLFYLSFGKASGIFKNLPELEIPKEFNKKKVFSELSKIKHQARRIQALKLADRFL